MTIAAIYIESNGKCYDQNIRLVKMPLDNVIHKFLTHFKSVLSLKVLA
ncbi:hypothetical protein DOY81_006429, partial [Sarcophaga bullata]